ncbi:50S ribosomal protein L4 [Candidatus Peregrinibacteria bacterium]|nr:50S ribosomal protein L4 [Candidatus Peregrinibacteria bacterium]
MKVDLYTQTGAKNGTLELPKEMFEVPFNKDLIHQALIRQLANARVSTAQAKTRGMVRGGGRKPFKQKGTGNARQGTTRAPHMKGGAVIFGPSTEVNHSKNMPKKQRRKALFSALSEKARSNEIIALEGYEAKEPKTKDFAALIAKLPIDRNVLVVIPEKDSIVQKSSSNLVNAKTITVNYLNIHDLQKYKHVLLFKDAIKAIEEVFFTATPKEGLKKEEAKAE